MRKLASILPVWKIEPIEGADRIELLHVAGWQCVAQKGAFTKGDHCVYFEIDAFLPLEDRYEFLRNSSYKKSDILGEGYLIRTQKLRGTLSQGLAMPLSAFPEIDPDTPDGTDVTELLHVKKWAITEKVSDSGTIIGPRPSFIPKTDEVRVQAMPELISCFVMPYYITSKMDGSSHSVGIDEDGSFHVTGHNYEYKDDGKSSFYEYINKTGIRERIIAYKKDHSDIKTFVIQGEWCGEGIQSNPVGLKKPAWFVFTVIINGKRLGLKAMEKVCLDLKITMAPLEEISNNFADKYPTVDAVLSRADGHYRTGRLKEGIVIRPIDPVDSQLLDGEPLSMKAVSNKYLLKKHKK